MTSVLALGSSGISLILACAAEHSLSAWAMNSAFVIEGFAVVVVAGGSASLSLLLQPEPIAALATTINMAAPIFRMLFPPLDTGIRETVGAPQKKFVVLPSDCGGGER